MSIYKMVETNGRGLRYFKDKKFIKKDNIPADILDQLEPGKDFSYDDNVFTPSQRKCIFCGMGCKMTRLIDAQVVYLCEIHYYDKNMGQIAQQLREMEPIAT